MAAALSTRRSPRWSGKLPSPMVMFAAGTFVIVQLTSVHVVRRVLLILPLIAVIIGVNHWKTYRAGDRAVVPIALCGLFLWALMSYSWSGDPHDTAHQVLEYCAVGLAGMISAMVLQREELVHAVAIGCKTLIVIVGGSLLVAYHTASAPPVLDPVPGWHGPLSGKNVLGFLMALAIITLIQNGHIRKSSPLWIVAAVILLVGSHSGAGLCIALLMMAILVWERALRGVTTRTSRMLYKVVSVILASGAAVFLRTDFPTAASLIGKNGTLTGRTKIWTAVLGGIAHKSAFGYGFAGVWFNKTGETGTLWQAIGFPVYEAHDTYLDALLQLGLVGLVLVVLVLGGALIRLLPGFRHRSPAERWLVLALVALMVEGVVESDLFSVDIFTLAVVVTASVVSATHFRGRISAIWRPRPTANKPGYQPNILETGRVATFLGNDLVRDAGWGSGVQVVTAAGSAFMFLVLARDLGPVGFGYYAALAGITGLIATLVNGWVPLVLSENVIRDKERATLSVASLSSWLAIGAGAALIATAALASVLVPDVPITTTIVYVAGSVVGLSVVGLGSSTIQSVQGYAAAARLPLMQQSLLLAALIGLWIRHDITLLSVGLAMLLTSAAVGIVSVRIAEKSCRVPFQFGKPRVSDLRRGGFYAAVLLAFAIEEDVDKPLLVRFGFARVAGLYSAAYNIVTIGLMPLNAATNSTHNRFLAHDPDALGEHRRRSLRFTAVSAGYGVAASAAILLCAPIIPSILGKGYEDTPSMIRFLAALILFRSLTVFADNGLMGLGKRGYRAFVLVVTAVVNVTLNVALIPVWSWKGSVFATLVGEACFLILTWIGLLWFQHLHDRGVRERAMPAQPEVDKPDAEQAVADQSGSSLEPAGDS